MFDQILDATILLHKYYFSPRSFPLYSQICCLQSSLNLAGCSGAEFKVKLCQHAVQQHHVVLCFSSGVLQLG